MNPIEIEKDIRALEATGVRCSGNPSLLPRTCYPAHACTHNVAKGVECRKPATHRVTRDGDNSMEWFFCAEHAAHRKGHIYTVTALENAPHEPCGAKTEK